MDQECLADWRRAPGAERLRPLVEDYLPFVYSSAYRRTGSADHARDVARAVFLTLARRAHKLKTKTVIAVWLFHVTAVACRKLTGRVKPISRTPWWRRWRRGVAQPDAPLWPRVAPILEPAIDRLSARDRPAVLLRVLLNRDPVVVARTLRTSEARVEKRAARGLNRLTRLLRRRRVVTSPETLAQVCAAEACAVPVPEGLASEILSEVDRRPGKRPSFKLARRTLNSLAWARWRRRLAIGIPSFVLALLTLGAVAWYIDSRTGHSRLISAILVWSVKYEGKTVPGLAQAARPWPASGSGPHLNAAEIRTAADLYQGTNIWLAHLQFTPSQWAGLEPKRITPLSHFLQADGSALLRNPEAQRSGLAGVLGFDFNWTSGNIEFGGLAFTNVAVRLKGNGTFLASLYGDKRPFKVDLNKYTKGQKLAGTDELTFNNLLNDFSCLSDALGYEFFRDAGIPAPRTAYAYLSASIDKAWDRKPLGLYVMVEAVDEDFAFERFGSKRTPIFKPVTYELFKHLGDDWQPYEAIYDLKTSATALEQRRVIEFAKLVTHAGDAEFAGQLGGFLDVERFARYLACEVLLSNYDSLLSNGQNFYLYLDPRSQKFGFIPWDLDFSWGGFFLLGTAEEREQASIWHPWVGQHRFLERVMAVPEFRDLYRKQLEDLLAGLFVPNRLQQRIDALAQVIRDPIAAESDFRLAKFERAISQQRQAPLPGERGHGANRTPHQLKPFIEARALSVRHQLDGTSQGVVLERSRRK